MNTGIYIRPQSQQIIITNMVYNKKKNRGTDAAIAIGHHALTDTFSMESRRSCCTFSLEQPISTHARLDWTEGLRRIKQREVQCPEHPTCTLERDPIRQGHETKVDKLDGQSARTDNTSRVYTWTSGHTCQLAMIACP
jgi:hypothetical protein